MIVRFNPSFFMFGLAYLPGIAVVIHFACFTIRFGGTFATD